MFQIMVVDDDRNTRRLFQAVLEAEGYRVLTAGDGQEEEPASAEDEAELVCSVP